MYKYHGEDHELESLEHFAIESWEEAHHKARVTIHPYDFWEELSYFWKREYAVKGGALATMLMMDEDGKIWFSAIFAVYLLPVITAVCFHYMMKSSFVVDNNI